MNILTVSNNNFKQHTRNLYESMKALELHEKLHVACFDKESLEYLDHNGVGNLTKEYKNFNYNRIFWGTGEFEHFCAYRINTYNKFLNEHKRCLFVDSDVVFIKNPIPLLEKYLDVHDVVGQSNMINGICCGFFAAKSSICDLFNSNKYQLAKKPINEYFDDERFFNSHVLKKINCKILANQEFPVGRLIYVKGILPSYYIAHFNYCDGCQNKMEKMKSYGQWRLND